MPIRGEGLVDAAGGDQGESQSIVYVLHPNCAVDDIVLPDPNKR
jgi:DNA replication licensing factor MCM6